MANFKNYFSNHFCVRLSFPRVTHISYFKYSRIQNRFKNGLRFEQNFRKCELYPFRGRFQFIFHSANQVPKNKQDRGKKEND